MAKTLLAIGAHYDDCVFGIPGILLDAVRKDWRVVVLALIGDYTNWPPVKGREKGLIETSTQLAHFHGIEMRFLDFASGGIEVTRESKKAVARVVAEVAPDVAFMLWEHDRHPDHEAAAALSKIALRQAGNILNDPKARAPRQIYCYDNGPGHTIGFEPNTFVNVTETWIPAMEWLGQLMAFVRNKPFEAAEPDAAQTAKANIARYRGAACGAKFAEALCAMNTHAVEIL